MVDIQSKEVIDKISEDLKIQPAMTIPREIAKQIQLVYGVNPDRLIRRASAGASDATTATILTTSAVKDTFLIAMQLTVSKDVVATSILSSIVGTPFGGITDLLLRIRYEPVTVGQFSQGLSLPIPMKLDRGSLVTVVNSTAVGSIDATAIIYFYETDPQ